MISISHLTKRFKKVTAVQDLSLQVAAGEIYGLVGPDGAGKTTTIRLICGAIVPNAGEVIVQDIDMRKNPERGRENLGYLAQRFSLYEELTVLENIRFFAEVRGLPAADWYPRCMEILHFVGLADFTTWRAGKLSGGMKQKLGLAAALVHRPRVLLLDEPSTGVDPVTRQDFWQLIIRLVESEKVTVLVSTPYMDEAARCSRLGFLLHGQLICEGTPKELRARLENRVLELQGAVLRELPMLRQIARAHPGIADVQMFGDCLHLRLGEKNAPAVIASLKARIHAGGYQVAKLQITSPQLEDVFMSLVED